MNKMMIVAGIGTLLLALGFGRLAVRRWRAQDRTVIDGLGLIWETGSATMLVAAFAITTFAMVGIFGAEYAGGFIGRGVAPSILPLEMAQTALIMICFATIEEILNRGLLLSGLVIALRGKASLAIFLSAALFGLAHLGNPGASSLSALGNALGGVIYGTAFVMTGRLWLPLGLHFAWNFVQGPVLGFPVSGMAMGGLQYIDDHGPAWLTGGAYGPEAGAIGIAFRFVVLALVLAWVKWSRRPKVDLAAA